MADVERLEDGTKVTDFFDELNAVRESGIINSFGIPQYLRETYELSKPEASKVFSAWTKSFDSA